MASEILHILQNPQRLAALKRLAILDTPAEQAFDRLTYLATTLLKVPVGLVTFVDGDRQFFKSVVGLGEPWISLRGTPLSHSFCQYTVAAGKPLIIEDARTHVLVADNLAIPDLGVIAYAGIPLITSDGMVLGAFCSIDTQPHSWHEGEIEVLQALAASVMSELELRSEINNRQQREAELREAKAKLEDSTAELQALNAELARAGRLKDEFLANMSHELRTPLNTILGMSESLQEQIYGPLNQEQLQALSDIGESGQHLLALINDILDLSKIEAGKFNLNTETVDIADVCRASLRMVKPAAQQKRLKVAAALGEPGLVVQADARRLRQILVNLLSNAIKFTPHGGAVGLEVAHDPEQGGVCFSVWDTGIGIAEQDMPHLFQPFTQLDSALSRQYAGTGLGLTLVHRMVELHGGSIAVQSVPGEGSRFVVTIPSAAREQACEAMIERSQRSSVAQPELAGQQHPVLLVEDNEHSIATISRYLAAKGFRVLVARNGIQALTHTKALQPAVVLMDIQMPEMDGFEAIRRIREDTTLVQPRIIALTALAMPGDRQRCLAGGADDYFSKPISLKELGSAIEAHVTAYCSARCESS